jgi:hypothetical protein
MNNYEKIYQELRQQYTDEEIAEGYMIPQQLTDEEQQASDAELRRVRFQLLNNRSEEQRMLSEVVRLRIQIQHYLEANIYTPDFDFGKIVERYITILNKSRKDFAEDIAIHPTKLSRIINSKDEPNSSLLYRLTHHSDQLIPLSFWWKLMARRQEHLVVSNSEALKSEGERVKNRLRSTL